MGNSLIGKDDSISRNENVIPEPQRAAQEMECSLGNQQGEVTASDNSGEQHLSPPERKSQTKENISSKTDGLHRSATDHSILRENNSSAPSQIEENETVDANMSELYSVNAISNSLSNCELQTGKDEEIFDEDETDISGLHDAKTETFSLLSEVKREMEQFIENPPGSMSTGGTASCLPCNPGLTIDNVGSLSIPIPDEHVHAIASNATYLSANDNNVSHGKQGTSTDAPTTCAMELSIDPCHIQIRNPAWKPCLDKLVMQVANELGVPSPKQVTYKLSQFKIFSEGCGNRSFHGGPSCSPRDKRGKRPFAMLIVQLPSRYTGSTTVVRHGDDKEKESYEFEKDAEYDCHYIAHFHDCDAEITKIHSGRRHALIYRLYHNTMEKLDDDESNRDTNDSIHNQLSAAAQFERRKRLGVLLQNLAPENRRIVLPLRHNYSPPISFPLCPNNEGLLLQTLKGEDVKPALAVLHATHAQQVASWKLAIVSTPPSDSIGQLGEQEELCWKKSGKNNLSWLNFVDVAKLTYRIEDGGWLLTSGGTIGTAHSSADNRVGQMCNEIRDSEITGTSCLLVLWSQTCELEVVCDANPEAGLAHCDALATQTTHSHPPLERVTRFLSRRQSDLSWEMFCALGSRSLLHPSVARPFPRKRVAMLFSLVPRDVDPSPEGTRFILSVLAASTWQTQRLIIKLVEDRVLSPKTKRFDSLLSFLKRYELAVFIKPYFSDLAFNLMSSSMMSVLKASKLKSILPSKSRTRSSIEELKHHVVKLLNFYRTDSVRMAIDRCIDAVLARKPQNDEVLFATFDLVRELTTRVPDNKDIGGYTQRIIEHFVSEMEKPTYSKKRSLLVNDDSHIFVRFLIEKGDKQHLDRISRWARIGPISEVSNFCGILTSIFSTLNYKYEEIDKWVSSIGKIVGKRMSEDAQGRSKKRSRTARSTSPKFDTVTLPQEIQKFLDSDDPGPMRYHHGRGFKQSRALERLSGPGFIIEAVDRFADQAYVVVSRLDQTKQKRLKTVVPGSGNLRHRLIVSRQEKAAAGVTGISVDSPESQSDTGALKMGVQHSLPISDINPDLPKVIRDFLASTSQGPLSYKHGQGIAFSQALAICTGKGYTIDVGQQDVVVSKATIREHRELQPQDLNTSQVDQVNCASKGSAVDGKTNSKRRRAMHTAVTTRGGNSEYNVTFPPGSFGLLLDATFKVVGGPAAAQDASGIGIKLGDTIVSIDGRRVTSFGEFLVGADRKRTATFRRGSPTKSRPAP